MTFMKLAVLLTLAPWLHLATPEAPTSPADGILGEWLTEAKDAKVSITREKGRYVGRITWLREPNGPDGRPARDVKNSEPALRERQLVGTAILWDLEWTGEGWEHGKLYDPEEGKIYSGRAKLNASHELELRGFVGISLFGRTEKWTRP